MDMAPGVIYVPETRILEQWKGAKIGWFVADGAVWIIVPWVCQALGVQAHGQEVRIKDDDSFAPFARIYNIMGARGPRPMLCIQKDKFAGWITSIQPKRVGPDFYAGVKRLRDEVIQAANVLLFSRGKIDVTALSNLAGISGEVSILDILAEYAKRIKDNEDFGHYLEQKITREVMPSRPRVVDAVVRKLHCPNCDTPLAGELDAEGFHLYIADYDDGDE